MAGPEYVRTHSEPAQSAFLGIPVPGGFAHFTFLHAGRSKWKVEDTGLSSPAEKGHLHPVYHVVLYTSGSNTMIHNGRAYPFTRGTLVLTEPGMLHEYRPRDAGGGSFMEITFDLRSDNDTVVLPWDEIMGLWTGKSIRPTPRPLLLKFPVLERLEWIIDEVLNHLTSNDPFSEESAGLAMGRFFVELTRYINSETMGVSDDQVDRLEIARRILEKKYASSVCVAELAEAAYLSEGAFIRGFSSRYGMPPMTYRKHLRITAAQHLLSVSGRPIGEIAVNVGYGDIYVFSRTFKSVTGVTPSQWRKERRRIAGQFTRLE